MARSRSRIGRSGKQKPRRHETVKLNLAAGRVIDFRSFPRGRVFVDGLERTYIKRCQLGPNGWAEQAVRTPDNKSILIRNEAGDVIGTKTRIVRGIVVFQLGG